MEMFDDMPNLDAMSNLDLLGFALNHIRTEAMTPMVEYAITKYCAKIAREDGRIADALRLENECDKLYAQLPEPFRW